MVTGRRGLNLIFPVPTSFEAIAARDPDHYDVFPEQLMS